MTVERIRRFNRYYTRILGIFDKKVFNLNYSMIEMRILGEIGRNNGITANALTKYLDIDKSYLSRILDKLLTANYISRKRFKRGMVYISFPTEYGTFFVFKERIRTTISYL